MDSETIRRGLTAMENIANYLKGIDESLFAVKTALIEEVDAAEARELDLTRGLLRRLYDVSTPIDERAETNEVYETVERVLRIVDGGIDNGPARPA